MKEKKTKEIPKEKKKSKIVKKSTIKKKKVSPTNNELIELSEIMEKVPDDKKSEAKMLEKELKFIITQITLVKKYIEKNGTVEEFKQGKQSFLRESPYYKSYLGYMKTYDTLFKSLIALTKTVVTNDGDSFDDFVANRDD
ncbi:MAG: hypothetical protein ACK5L6_01115 [Anaerorhabdus sp.]|uniref:hypothetical protein n=1 Tax=Anaerorhabdus sp. TaxID=1872524 RepID=UPI003A894E78